MYVMLSSHRKVWSQKAICTEYPKLFGDDLTKSTISAAKGICKMCPVVDLCREWAIINEVEGMFGGTTTTERKALRKGLAPEVLAQNPPEPKLLDYVKEETQPVKVPPKVIHKPALVQTNPGAYTVTEKPKYVGQKPKSKVKRTPQSGPLSLLASLDQLLLDTPIFS